MESADVSVNDSLEFTEEREAVFNRLLQSAQLAMFDDDEEEKDGEDDEEVARHANTLNGIEDHDFDSDEQDEEDNDDLDNNEFVYAQEVEEKNDREASDLDLLGKGDIREEVEEGDKDEESEAPEIEVEETMDARNGKVYRVRFYDEHTPSLAENDEKAIESNITSEETDKIVYEKVKGGESENENNDGSMKCEEQSDSVVEEVTTKRLNEPSLSTVFDNQCNTSDSVEEKVEEGCEPREKKAQEVSQAPPTITPETSNSFSFSDFSAIHASSPQHKAKLSSSWESSLPPSSSPVSSPPSPTKNLEYINVDLSPFVTFLKNVDREIKSLTSQSTMHSSTSQLQQFSTNDHLIPFEEALSSQQQLPLEMLIRQVDDAHQKFLSEGII